jgi:hypothetical protein
MAINGWWTSVDHRDVGAPAVRCADHSASTVTGVARIDSSVMPEILITEETRQRLDRLRVDDESDDEMINELINIYEASERTLFHGGDTSS